MKKINLQSLIAGLLIGGISTSAFLLYREKTINLNNKDNYQTASVEEVGKIVTANADYSNLAQQIKMNNIKVYFNGKEVQLEKPLAILKKDDSSEEELYMPVDEILEYMNFKVQWNKEDNAVYLTMGQYNDADENTDLNISDNDADAKAIEIIQKTGNWGYVEEYIPHMSNSGIDKIVGIYNSKHMNPAEHKKASDYYKK